ncbi:MAG: hypothetical protein DRP51_02190 [Candidatus Zixiibacteriota bacterium]|nr:MAG: hypothetical protein DRP51_02190 [candidate division Zixibacteria bacterium]HHI03457.1 hypothetical protein [candidate division Zixibacteria bacterium]
MYLTIKQFVDDWKNSSDATRKLMGVLTDQSLNQKVAEEHRTLGRIAWHLATTIPEMANRTGLNVKGPQEDALIPNIAFEIMDGYDVAANSLLEQIMENWTDGDLQLEDEMYGEKWRREFTLRVLREHEIHHRGQMTVLMRQAGLEIPGLYGPSKEEWTKFGMEEPKI